MTVLYFDCFSGASGDMILGALVDAGVPLEVVQRAVTGLGIEGWSLTETVVTRGGLRATRIKVTGEDDQPSRSWRDIQVVIQGGSLDPAVEARAMAAFALLAEAEGRVHGVAVQDVHFHEVGAIDALVDIVGSCAAIEHLGPERVVTSAVATGTGTVETEHGTLPLPAPAVAELLRGVPVASHGDQELITPTGAALLKAFTSEFGELPAMTLRAVGYGAGRREGTRPNVLRVFVGDEVVQHPDTEGSLLIEANIDDMIPELFPHAIDALIAAGAHDAWVTPIVMKKGRPAFTLSVLGGAKNKDRLLDVVFRETTTFGVRMTPVDKQVLDREWVEVEVEGHTMRVKLARRAGEVVTVSPEFADASVVARATGLALKDVYRKATDAATARVRR